MNKSRLSSWGFALLAGLCATAAGCQPSAPGAPAGQESQPVAAASCVEHNGLTHCSLGAAALTPSRDGATLKVSGARDASSDGVAILLPDATDFTQPGTIPGAPGLVFKSSAVAEGVTTSTLTVNKGQTSYSVAPTFTGAGDASTYSARFFANGQETGAMNRLASGQAVRIGMPRRCPYGWAGVWPVCVWIGFPDFHLRDNGACAWGLTLAGAGTVALADGRTVLVDRVEFEEDVPAGGSYPYTAFDRLGYTSNGDTFVLGTPAAK